MINLKILIVGWGALLGASQGWSQASALDKTTAINTAEIVAIKNCLSSGIQATPKPGQQFPAQTWNNIDFDKASMKINGLEWDDSALAFKVTAKKLSLHLNFSLEFSQANFVASQFRVYKNGSPIVRGFGTIMSGSFSAVEDDIIEIKGYFNGAGPAKSVGISWSYLRASSNCSLL